MAAVSWFNPNKYLINDYIIEFGGYEHKAVILLFFYIFLTQRQNIIGI